MDPDTRFRWMDEVHALMLSAYEEGLASDISIKFVFWGWDGNGHLDCWRQESVPVKRLNDPSRTQPLQLPFVRLKAVGYFPVRIEDAVTDETESEAAYSADFGDILLMPFELERAFWGWRAGMPGVEIQDWEGSLFRPFRRADFPEASSGAASWQAFNREGLSLSAKLQAMLGTRATVIYRRPDEDVSDSQPRNVKMQ